MTRSRRDEAIGGPIACQVCEEDGTSPAAEPAMIGEGVNFERTRRITGYLAPTARWNNAKKAELKDRVRHGFAGEGEKKNG